MYICRVYIIYAQIIDVGREKVIESLKKLNT